jgi:sterol desaturase/sphingolipid hydroxylase (fatty acid hydroxylase superfamily)
MTEQGLHLIASLYCFTYAATLVFFLAWEGTCTRRQIFRIGRNLALFALVVILADVIVGDWMMGGTDLLRAMPTGLVSGPGDSIVKQWVIGFFAADLFAYWFHRLLHRVRGLSWFHAVHHSDPTVDASTGLRTHPVEAALSVAGVISLFMLLGIPLWIEGVRTLLLNSLTVAHHADVRYPRWFEHGLRWLIITPGVHRLHHSTQAVEHNKNFGTTLSVWDRLFGTYCEPKPESATEPGEGMHFGLQGLNKDSWQTLGGMLLMPWRVRHARLFSGEPQKLSVIAPVTNEHEARDG